MVSLLVVNITATRAANHMKSPNVNTTLKVPLKHAEQNYQLLSARINAKPIIIKPLIKTNTSAKNLTLSAIVFSKFKKKL